MSLLPAARNSSSAARTCCRGSPSAATAVAVPKSREIKQSQKGNRILLTRSPSGEPSGRAVDRFPPVCASEADGQIGVL